MSVPKTLRGLSTKVMSANLTKSCYQGVKIHILSLMAAFGYVVTVSITAFYCASVPIVFAKLRNGNHS